MEVVPVNFGLKYKPPKLGVEYYLKESPATHFVHEIPLAFVTQSANVDALTKEIIEKNKFYLNPKVVSAAQVRRLVDRLVKQLASREDKENANAANAKQGLTGTKAPLQKELNSPTLSEQSSHQAYQQLRAQENNSISRIESVLDDDGHADLLISDIQHNKSRQEDVEQLLQTGAFTKEMLLGQTLRDLGSSIKCAADDDLDAQPASQLDSRSQDGFGDDLEPNSQRQDQPQVTGEEEDVIDIDNPDDLAAKGLRRIQIEGEEEEFLMDLEGNIYDLRGNFIGTTDGEGGAEQNQTDSHILADEEYAEGDEY